MRRKKPRPADRPMEHAFDVDVSVDRATGAVVAVYFEVRKGRSAETREFGGGAAFADFDKVGRLLGIELLAPCKLSVLNRIARAEPREVRNFVKSAAPRSMVLA